MANEKHLSILQQGVKNWNLWRAKNADIPADLKGADLSGQNLNEFDFDDTDFSEATLNGATFYKASFQSAILKRANLSKAQLSDLDLEDVDLTEAILSQANLSRSHLLEASLTEADLSGANLHNVELFGANLRKANLKGADLSYARLIEADLREADLYGANLSYCTLHGTNFRGANLTKANLDLALLVSTHLENATISDCSIYGIAAWNVGLDGATQRNLSINDFDEPSITVDNLEVGQFIHLLLNNQKVRSVIDTVTSKAVLILGRFTPERKTILDALREQLRELDYLPILFDFDKPSSRNLTETVSTIAHLARFVIADITEAKSIPQELQRIVPSLPSVPIQPILHSEFQEYGMFKDLLDYHTVLTPYRYDSLENLLLSLKDKVIAPAVIAARKVMERRARIEKEISENED
jgi:uncharacterized protein YjbI with pentapeptide repeats